ncbi:MAG: hypothetical protein QGG63_00180 [Candidatus Pacebacteria bacterium]|jgi:hypothetical protein|nr:hypothetical protein [Candidatus Paceibacterota bacterium]|tara:strand:+ start:52386 stop:53672 length:1287 start_codon:yes stop_codon:yes gene_type:complete
MAKDSFQDIVPPKKRTIRNIQSSHARVQRPQKMEDDFEYDAGYGRVIRKPHSSRIALWFVAVIVIIVLVLAFSLLFSGAKVIITPKQNRTLIDVSSVAVLDGSAEELSYEIMTIEETSSKKIAATGREEIEEKASGRIVIFNDFNTSSQRLIKNTRFETSEGLIYRINKSVVVPGQKTEDGEKVPGSVEVTVYADEAGEGFNIGLMDFTIPGFKGSPRFAKFYARSKTPMTGGFVGEKLTADPAEAEKAKNEIHTELREQLLAEAFSQKPDEFYLFEDIIFIEFESQPDAESGNEVEIIEQATLYGVLFEKQKFAEYIAKKTLAEFDEGPVRIADTSTLAVNAQDKEEARPWEDGEFKFTMKGNAHIVWIFDEEKLKSDLSGRAKAALLTILTGYPSIGQAEVILRPVWKRSFPDKTSKIKIELILDK